MRSLTQLRDTTTEELVSGLIDASKLLNEAASLLIENAIVIDKPELKFNRKTNDGAVQKNVGCTTTIANNNIATVPVTIPLQTYVRQFDVCTIGQNLYSSYTDVVASELSGAVQALTEAIVTDAFIGDGTNEILGLDAQVATSFAAAGPTLDLADLDALYDAVVSKGPRMAFIGNPTAVRAVIRELREASALNYQEISGTNFRVPEYLGYPVLRAAGLPAGSLYFVNLDEFKLVFGENVNGNLGQNLGIYTLQDLGPSQTTMVNLWRVYIHVNAALLNTQGAAELTGVA